MKIEIDAKGQLVIDIRNAVGEFPPELSKEFALSLACRDDVFREAAEMLITGHTTDQSTCSWSMLDEQRLRVAASAGAVAADMVAKLTRERDAAREDARKERGRVWLLEQVYDAAYKTDEALRNAIKARQELR